MGKSSIRIGGASGFWGDSAIGAPQLVRHGQIDYLVFDYLAELTMSILASARMKDPKLGYATDFVAVAMRAVLPDVVAKGIKVVSNAGGMNPMACAKALRELADELNVPLKVSVVCGDDLMPQMNTLADLHLREMQTGAPLPSKLLSANAYLGAYPICRALDGGADVVITGRCVDSAVTLGVLMHEFGWRIGSADDLDRLAQGSLAGHLIECGAQATGGLFTDWESVPNWARMGYPVVVCDASGVFEVTKPPGTGGLVSVATVAEQLVYEIGDPANYLLPDVVCDFTEVSLTQVADNQVRVNGARGKAPPSHYKVTSTYQHGFRCSGQLTIVGMDAPAKARRTGEALLERTREMFRELGWGDYEATHIEALGAESAYGPHANAGAMMTRECILRLTMNHANKRALEVAARELSSAGTSFAPGTTGAGGGRPKVSPNIRQFAFLIPKPLVSIDIHHFDGNTEVLGEVAQLQKAQALVEDAPLQTELFVPEIHREVIQVPLIRLAYGRSGDKGDTSNIGVIARDPQFLPLLREQLTESAVANWLAFVVKGAVRRYELPGIHAFNFVCESALDGGGMASMRNDSLGKGMAQILLSMPISVDLPLAWRFSLTC